MTIVRDEPVYTFIHVALPHPPYVVNEDCSFIGPQRASRPTYAAQGRCALTVVQKLFDRLRALGVYDRTVIVLTSDHGWNRLRPDHPLEGIRTPAGTLNEVAVRAMPLLAVKPAGSLGSAENILCPHGHHGYPRDDSRPRRHTERPVARDVGASNRGWRQPSTHLRPPFMGQCGLGANVFPPAARLLGRRTGHRPERVVLPGGDRRFRRRRQRPARAV